MSEHMAVVVALGMVAICSIAVVVALPALAMAAIRGKLRGAVRFGVITLVAVVLAIAFAAVIGVMPAAYSTFL